MKSRVSLLKTLIFPLAGLSLAFPLDSFPTWAQAITDHPAWAPAARAHAQKMRQFKDADIGKDDDTRGVIPKFDRDDDPSGAIATFQPGGPTSMQFNGFFQDLGQNERTCFTCHKPQTGWSVSAASVQARFDKTGGKNPIFRLVDGATCPTDDVSTLQAKSDAYKLLRTKGLFRIGLPLPQTTPTGGPVQFSVAIASDPYNCSNNSTVNVTTSAGTIPIYSFYRRPLPSTNLLFQNPPGNPETPIMWDGREPSLFHQSIDATLTHAQAMNPPTPDQQNQIVSFESGLFTAQDSNNNALSLYAAHATGGAKALQAFVAATPTPLPATSTSTVIPVFDLYTPWASLNGTDPVSQARESIARGEAVFNAKSSKCGFCHNTVDIGNKTRAKLFNTGVADADPVASPFLDTLDITGLPVFTVTCNAAAGPIAGTVLTVTDLGLGMITGQCADIGSFKAPILRGLASRAPYFHNGSAATLKDVVNFYNERFSLGLSATDQQDLVNFLNAL